MRNKILIVDANQEDREQFEMILQEIVRAGGELFFAETREDGLSILTTEQPQMVFLDVSLAGELTAWLFDKVHVVLMCNKRDQQQASGDYILKPIKKHPVLEKCHAVLSKVPASSIPPM